MTDGSNSWLRSAEQGEVEIEGQDLILRDTYVSGTVSALSVRYFRTGEQTARAKVVFGPGTQGRPGCAHGGSMAALLDEVMGFAVWCSGRTPVSVDLNVHFRKTLPIPQRCIAEARVERIEGRKVWTSALLRDVSGETIFAEAEGMYLEYVERAR